MNCLMIIYYSLKRGKWMATVKIRPIKQTLNLSFDYGQADKIEYVQKVDDLDDAKNQGLEQNFKDDLDNALKYIEADKNERNYKGKTKIYKTISTGIGCTPETAFFVSNLYRNAATANRPNARKYTKRESIGWHCHQNFEESPKELSVEKAHEIGVEFAKKMFGDFPCVVSTHWNTEHIHNHIIFGAWNAEGKKWNQCNSKYQEMRSFSDELCEKNGLHVLEKTRKMKLIRWKDDKGQIHYYEPTKRKDEKYPDNYADSNDYRNTTAYEKMESDKKTNRQTIREDIDALLPVVQDYEDLLFCLRNIGYEIKDKRQDGSYLKHISFKAPGADKATRDYKISEDGFYIRENLEEEIARKREKKIIELSDKAKQIDVDRGDDGKIRNILEKKIITNIKASADKLNVRMSKRTMYYVNSISAGFEALHYVEVNRIDSLDKLREIQNDKASRLREIQSCLTPELQQQDQMEYDNLLTEKAEMEDDIEKAGNCIRYISGIEKDRMRQENKLQR